MLPCDVSLPNPGSWVATAAPYSFDFNSFQARLPARPIPHVRVGQAPERDLRRAARPARDGVLSERGAVVLGRLPGLHERRAQWDECGGVRVPQEARRSRLTSEIFILLPCASSRWTRRRAQHRGGVLVGAGDVARRRRAWPSAVTEQRLDRVTHGRDVADEAELPHVLGVVVAVAVFLAAPSDTE